MKINASNQHLFADLTSRELLRHSMQSLLHLSVRLTTSLFNIYVPAESPTNAIYFPVVPSLSKFLSAQI